MLIPIDSEIVPDGYEPVRFGLPNIGDHYIDGRDIFVATVSIAPRLIVRKKWQPPEWLKPGWIAMDGDGCWMWFQSLPFLKGDEWFPRQGDFCAIDLPCVEFTPPQAASPATSLQQIDQALRKPE